MSRIGRSPITVPAGVEVKLAEGNVLTVKGPKGTLERAIHPNMTVNIEPGVINVTRPDDEKLNRSLHGLTRTLIANMVEGVSNGFKKILEINGVGYRAAKDGNTLVMNLGYSHQVKVDEIPGITIEVPAQNQVIVNGIDKQLVGQFAADIRKKRPPERYYPGKGIKYSTEVLHLKPGKTGSK